MKITKDTLVNKITAYLNRSITLKDLVDWAENMVCEGEFAEEDFELTKEIVSRLGVSDVKEFGLSWDDCYDYLSRLGHRVTVTVT